MVIIVCLAYFDYQATITGVVSLNVHVYIIL